MPKTSCIRPSRTFLVLGLLSLTFALSAHAGGLIELQPQGPVAAQERNLILITVGLMLFVLLPVFGMTLWFAWHYRAGNERATYMPKWESLGLDVVVWLGPSLIVLILAILTWNYTHSLNPYKPIASDVKPLKVQVVALDWKWLFIYPEQGVASVNQLVIPTDRPVSFDITSDTVMNSFFIPQLGGQIYAMAGMRTELHLQADKPGTYFGENTQYSGRGFPFQNFEVQARAQKGFDAWVQKVRQQGKDLDWSRYRALEKPSVRDPVSHYAEVDNGLFQRVMAKYMPGKGPAAMQPAS